MVVNIPILMQPVLLMNLILMIYCEIQDIYNEQPKVNAVIMFVTISHNFTAFCYIVKACIPLRYYMLNAIVSCVVITMATSTGIIIFVICVLSANDNNLSLKILFGFYGLSLIAMSQYNAFLCNKIYYSYSHTIKMFNNNPDYIYDNNLRPNHDELCERAELIHSDLIDKYVIVNEVYGCIIYFPLLYVFLYIIFEHNLQISNSYVYHIYSWLSLILPILYVVVRSQFISNRDKIYKIRCAELIFYLFIVVLLFVYIRLSNA